MRNVSSICSGLLTPVTDFPSIPHWHPISQWHVWVTNSNIWVLACSRANRFINDKMYNINLLFIWCDWHWHSKWQYIYDVFTVHNIRISYITRELYNNNNYDFALSTGAVWIAGWRALRNLFIQYFITISCGRVRAQFSLALVWACACASFDCSNRQRTYKWERLYWSNKNWIIVMVWPKCGLSGEFRLDSRAHYD